MSEKQSRNTKKMEKVSPYHSIDKEHSLEKIALQTGVVSPTQVGVELKDKNGDESALEMRRPQQQEPSEDPNEGNPEV